MKQQFPTPLRAVALVTLACFLATSVIEPAYAQVIRLDASSAPILKAPRLQLPPTLGKLEAMYVPPMEKKTQVYYLEDAHASSEAQEKIFEILKWLKNDRKLDAVLTEGAVGELRPTGMNFFKDAPRNQALWDQLFQEGLISGVEKFLLLNPKVPAFGIEDLSDYQQNLQSFRKVLSKRGDADAFLVNLGARLNAASRKLLPPDAAKLLKQWRLLKKDQLDLSEYLSALFQYSSKYLNFDWDDYEIQGEWKHLIRLHKLQFRFQSLDPKKIKSELKSFENKYRLILPVEIEQIKQWLALPLASENASAEPLPHAPRAVTESIFGKLLTAGGTLNSYPNLRQFLAHRIFQGEIESIGLFEEIEKLEDKLFHAMTQGPQGYAQVVLHRDFYILSSALHLEMVRDQVGQFRKRLQDFAPERFKKAVGLRTIPSENLVASLLPEVVRFYAGAEGRESGFIQNTLKQTGGDTKSPASSRHLALIAGGYHRSGLESLFVNSHIPYFVIQPQFKGSSDSRFYEQSMFGKYIKSSHISAARGALMGEGSLREMMGEEVVGRFYMKVAQILNEYLKQNPALKTELVANQENQKVLRNLEVIKKVEDIQGVVRGARSQVRRAPETKARAASLGSADFFSTIKVYMAKGKKVLILALTASLMALGGAVAGEGPAPRAEKAPLEIPQPLTLENLKELLLKNSLEIRLEKIRQLIAEKDRASLKPKISASGWISQDQRNPGEVSLPSAGGEIHVNSIGGLSVKDSISAHEGVDVVRGAAIDISEILTDDANLRKKYVELMVQTAQDDLQDEFQKKYFQTSELLVQLQTLQISIAYYKEHAQRLTGALKSAEGKQEIRAMEQIRSEMADVEAKIIKAQTESESVSIELTRLIAPQNISSNKSTPRLKANIDFNKEFKQRFPFAESFENPAVREQIIVTLSKAATEGEVRNLDLRRAKRSLELEKVSAQIAINQTLPKISLSAKTSNDNEYRVLQSHEETTGERLRFLEPSLRYIFESMRRFDADPKAKEVLINTTDFPALNAFLGSHPQVQNKRIYRIEELLRQFDANKGTLKNYSVSESIVLFRDLVQCSREIFGKRLEKLDHDLFFSMEGGEPIQAKREVAGLKVEGSKVKYEVVWTRVLGDIQSRVGQLLSLLQEEGIYAKRVAEIETIVRENPDKYKLGEDELFEIYKNLNEARLKLLEIKRKELILWGQLELMGAVDEALLKKMEPLLPKKAEGALQPEIPAESKMAPKKASPLPLSLLDKTIASITWKKDEESVDKKIVGARVKFTDGAIELYGAKPDDLKRFTRDMRLNSVFSSETAAPESVLTEIPLLTQMGYQEAYELAKARGEVKIQDSALSSVRWIQNGEVVSGVRIRLSNGTVKSYGAEVGDLAKFIADLNLKFKQANQEPVKEVATHISLILEATYQDVYHLARLKNEKEQRVVALSVSQGKSLGGVLEKVSLKILQAFLLVGILSFGAVLAEEPPQSKAKVSLKIITGIQWDKNVNGQVISASLFRDKGLPLFYDSEVDKGNLKKFAEDLGLKVESADPNGETVVIRTSVGEKTIGYTEVPLWALGVKVTQVGADPDKDKFIIQTSDGKTYQGSWKEVYKDAKNQKPVVTQAGDKPKKEPVSKEVKKETFTTLYSFTGKTMPWVTPGGETGIVSKSEGRIQLNKSAKQDFGTDEEILTLEDTPASKAIETQKKKVAAVKGELKKLSSGDKKEILKKLVQIDIEETQLNNLENQRRLFETYQAPFSLKRIQSREGTVGKGDWLVRYISKDRIQMKIALPPAVARSEEVNAFINGKTAKVVNITYDEVGQSLEERNVTIELELSAPLEDLNRELEYTLHFKGSEPSPDMKLAPSASVLAETHARVFRRERVALSGPFIKGRIQFQRPSGEKISDGDRVEKGEFVKGLRAEDLKFYTDETSRKQSLLEEIQRFLDSAAAGIRLDEKSFFESQVNRLKQELGEIDPVRAQGRAPQDGILMESNLVVNQVETPGRSDSSILTHQVFIGDMNSENIDSMVLIDKNVKIPLVEFSGRGKVPAVVVMLPSGRELLGVVTYQSENKTNIANPKANLKGYKAITVEVSDAEYLLTEGMPVHIRVVDAKELEKFQAQGESKSAKPSYVPKTYKNQNLPLAVQFAISQPLAKGEVLEEKIVSLILKETLPQHRIQAFRNFVGRFGKDHLEKIILEGAPDVRQEALSILRNEMDIINLFKILDRAVSEKKAEAVADTYRFLVDILESTDASVLDTLESNSRSDSDLRKIVEKGLVSVLVSENLENPDSIAKTRILRSNFWNIDELIALAALLERTREPETAKRVEWEILRRSAATKNKQHQFGLGMQTVRGGFVFIKLEGVENNWSAVVQNFKSDADYLNSSPYWWDAERYLDDRILELSMKDVANLKARPSAVLANDQVENLAGLLSSNGQHALIRHLSIQEQDAYIDQLIHRKNYRDLAQLLLLDEMQDTFARKILNALLSGSGDSLLQLARIYSLASGEKVMRLIEKSEKSLKDERSDFASRLLKAAVSANDTSLGSDASARLEIYQKSLIKLYRRSQSADQKLSVLKALMRIVPSDFELPPLVGGNRPDPRLQDLILSGIPVADIQKASRHEIERRAVLYAIRAQEERYGLNSGGEFIPGQESTYFSVLKHEFRPDYFGKFSFQSALGDEDSPLEFLQSFQNASVNDESKAIMGRAVSLAEIRRDNILANYREKALSGSLFWYVFASALLLPLFYVLAVYAFYKYQQFARHVRRKSQKSSFDQALEKAAIVKELEMLRWDLNDFWRSEKARQSLALKHVDKWIRSLEMKLDVKKPEPIGFEAEFLKGSLAYLSRYERGKGMRAFFAALLLPFLQKKWELLKQKHEKEWENYAEEPLNEQFYDNNTLSRRFYAILLKRSEAIMNDKSLTYASEHLNDPQGWEVEDPQRIFRMVTQLSQLTMKTLYWEVNADKMSKKPIDEEEKAQLFGMAEALAERADYFAWYRHILISIVNIKSTLSYEITKLFPEGSNRFLLTYQWFVNKLGLFVAAQVRLLYGISKMRQQSRGKFLSGLETLIRKANGIQEQSISEKEFEESKKLILKPEFFQPTGRKIDLTGTNESQPRRKLFLSRLFPAAIGTFPLFVFVAGYLLSLGIWVNLFAAAISFVIGVEFTLFIQWWPALRDWFRDDPFYQESHETLDTVESKLAKLLVKDEKKRLRGKELEEFNLNLEVETDRRAMARELDPKKKPSASQVVVIYHRGQSRRDDERQETFTNLFSDKVRKDVPFSLHANQIGGSGAAYLEAKYKAAHDPSWQGQYPYLPKDSEDLRNIFYLAGENDLGVVKEAIGKGNFATAYRATRHLEKKNKFGDFIMNGNTDYDGPLTHIGGITLITSPVSYTEATERGLGLIFSRPGVFTDLVKIIEKPDKASLRSLIEANTDLSPQFDLDNEKKRQFPAFTGVVLVSFPTAEGRREYNEYTGKLYKHLVLKVKEAQEKDAKIDLSKFRIDLTKDILIPFLLMYRRDKENWTESNYLKHLRAYMGARTAHLRGNGVSGLYRNFYEFYENYPKAFEMRSLQSDHSQSRFTNLKSSTEETSSNLKATKIDVFEQGRQETVQKVEVPTPLPLPVATKPASEPPADLALSDFAKHIEVVQTEPQIKTVLPPIQSQHLDPEFLKFKERLAAKKKALQDKNNKGASLGQVQTQETKILVNLEVTENIADISLTSDQLADQLAQMRRLIASPSYMAQKVMEAFGLEGSSKPFVEKMVTNLLAEKPLTSSPDSNKVLIVDAQILGEDALKRLCETGPALALIFPEQDVQKYDAMRVWVKKRGLDSRVHLVKSPGKAGVFLQQALRLRSSEPLRLFLEKVLKGSLIERAEDIAFLSATRKEANQIQSVFVGHRYFWERSHEDNIAGDNALLLFVQAGEVFRKGKGKAAQDLYPVLKVFFKQLFAGFKAQAALQAAA